MNITIAKRRSKDTAPGRLYDFRRLVVFSSEIESRAAIWQPLIGHDGIFRGGMVVLHEARAISSGQLDLPAELMQKIDEWRGSLSEISKRRSISSDDRAGHRSAGALIAEAIADIVGEQFQVEFDGNKILLGLDRPVVTREFVFEKQYASLRNSWDFTFPKYRTYISSLLWRRLSSIERERLFSGKFDLGNKVPVPPKDCTIGNLVAELRNDPLYSYVDENSHPFKSIEDGVKATLGRSLKSYRSQDPSSALKVVKLLFRMQKSRHNRIFKFLQFPAIDRYSMEMREILPFRKDDITTEDAVWLLADLKTYLGLDLPEMAFNDIQGAFWPLQKTVQDIRRGVDQVLNEAFGEDYNARANAYADLTDFVRDFETTFVPEDLPLDQDLCSYVQSLEFLHSAVAIPELIPKSIPSELKIVAVRSEIATLTDKVTKKWGIDVNPDQPAHMFALNDVSSFVDEFNQEICDIIAKAAGQPVNESDLTVEVVQEAYLILHNYFWLVRDAYWASVDANEKRISPWLVIGALYCALDAKLRTPKPHAPYWRLMPRKDLAGAATPTESLRSALKDTLHLQRRADRMTLEHRQIWRIRLEWFCECLYGMEVLIIPSLQFHVSVLAKFMEVTRRTRDGTSNKGAQSELIEYIWNCTHELHRKSVLPK